MFERMHPSRVWGVGLSLLADLLGAALPAGASPNCQGVALTNPHAPMTGTAGNDVLLGTSAGV